MAALPTTFAVISVEFMLTKRMYPHSLAPSTVLTSIAVYVNSFLAM